jgi:anti-sigma regulatory factor (Ser/Thr protein kinase)
MTKATTLRGRSELRYRFTPRTSASVWLARELLGQWLRERDVTAEEAGDLLLVCSELTTNAVRHAGTHSIVHLRCWYDAGCFHLEVEDEPAPGAPAGEIDDEAGGGDLRVAAALCDSLTIRVRGECTTISCRRTLSSGSWGP